MKGLAVEQKLPALSDERVRLAIRPRLRGKFGAQSRGSGKRIVNSRGLGKCSSRGEREREERTDFNAMIATRLGHSSFAVQQLLCYCTTMMGACQNVALPSAGSSTVTWQSYLPGSSGPRSMVKLSGTISRRVFGSGVTSCGWVS